MSKKKEEWNPFDTMSEEYMKSIKFKRFCIFASEFRNLDVLYTR